MLKWVLILLLGIIEGCRPDMISKQSGKGGEGKMIKITGKRIVMIIAHSNFRDEEYFKPKAIFEAGGAEVKTASSSLEESRGILGRCTQPDMLISDINVSDYDAVVFIGGSGSREYWDSPIAHKVVKETIAANKILAAICSAPVILANAGALKSKKATVFAGDANYLYVKGAYYTRNRIEVDDKIITADGPASAIEFGQVIARLLAQGK